MICGFVLLCAVASLLAKDELIDLCVVRRTFRSRRFGLPMLFGFTAVVAVTMWLMRLLLIETAGAMALLLGVFLSAFAVAIVGFVVLIVQNLFGRDRFRLRMLRRKFERNASFDDSGHDSKIDDDLQDGCT